jgi:hypothetical protein
MVGCQQVESDLTSMHAEYAVIDHDTESEKVEHVREVLPDDW